MAIHIEEVNPKSLKPFIKFPFKLYKGNPYYVPPIIDFEVSTLSPKKNPAFKHCEARYWIAKDGENIVGRIAGIIHSKELEEKSLMRIGWIDFIDDLEVSKLLFDTAIAWGESKGATGAHGPLGFTDLDFEGLLIEGFDIIASQATIYNYPYYKDHFEQYGFEKACDWVEIHGALQGIPDKLIRMYQKITERYGLTNKKFKRNRDMLKYADQVFDILNQTYSDLYGYYPLSTEQIQYYIKLYFGFIIKEYVSILVNEMDEVVAFAISMPSLSKAFQKAKGKLYPFGFIHILKAFYFGNHVDLFLIGVRPKYQRLGANALMFHDMQKACLANGVNWVSTGPMMETNSGVLNLWNAYDENLKQAVRRRCFIKKFDNE
ncbi:MAG: hypothetical protein ACFHWX_04670 [Bacteroidota bacterium]